MDEYVVVKIFKISNERAFEFSNKDFMLMPIKSKDETNVFSSLCNYMYGKNYLFINIDREYMFFKKQ